MKKKFTILNKISPLLSLSEIKFQPNYRKFIENGRVSAKAERLYSPPFYVKQVNIDKHSSALPTPKVGAPRCYMESIIPEPNQ